MIEILANSDSGINGKIIGVGIAKIAIISYLVYTWLKDKKSDK
jgi:hypothetical protein